MDFFDWNMLGSFAGAVFAVGLLTQITKSIPGIVKIPTQIWSYILALAVLELSAAFTQGLTLSGAALALFNAALVSLSANGGHQALVKMKDSIKTE